MIIKNSASTSLVETLDRFKNISRKSIKVLSHHGIRLNFQGYEDFIDELSMVDDTSIESILEVLRKVSLWKNYFDELIDVISMIRSGLENKELYLEAFRDNSRENKKLEEKIADNVQELEVVYNYEVFLKMLSKTLDKARKEIINDQKESLKIIGRQA